MNITLNSVKPISYNSPARQTSRKSSRSETLSFQGWNFLKNISKARSERIKKNKIKHDRNINLVTDLIMGEAEKSAFAKMNNNLSQTKRDAITNEQKFKIKQLVKMSEYFGKKAEKSKTLFERFLGIFKLK